MQTVHEEHGGDNKTHKDARHNEEEGDDVVLHVEDDLHHGTQITTQDAKCQNAEKEHNDGGDP